jgi:peptidoglycan/LPS O-acetylase OafA/YrhL
MIGLVQKRNDPAPEQGQPAEPSAPTSLGTNMPSPEMGTAPAVAGPAKPPSRLLSLDLLRTLAVLLVLGHHAFAAWKVPSDWPEYIRAPFSAWVRGGWVGVDLFFVLSGFLVSGLLFSEHRRSGHISPLRFYIRRGFKIYPSFYVFLGISVAILSVRAAEFTSQELLADAFFVQNYLPDLPTFDHTWSLAVEEHFYVALPLFLMALTWRRSNGVPFARLPIVVAGICLAVLGLRIWHAAQTSYDFKSMMAPTHLRIDSLLFGVLVAYFWHCYPTRFREILYPWRRWLMVLGPALFIPAFVVPRNAAPFICTGGLTFFYLGGAALMAGILLSAVPVNIVTRFLGFLGAHSYSVYLWHVAVIKWGVPGLERVSGMAFPPFLSACLAIAGGFVFGVIMAKLVEHPALALREFLFSPRCKERPQLVQQGAYP